MDNEWLQQGEKQVDSCKRQEQIASMPDEMLEVTTLHSETELMILELCMRMTLLLPCGKITG